MKYLIDIIHNEYINQIESMEEYDLFDMVTYHHIDMLLTDDIDSYKISDYDKRKLIEKKKRIVKKRERYINELCRLNLIFVEHSINFILLKGCSLVLSDYNKYYYRYFGDIDILLYCYSNLSLYTCKN